MNKKLVLTLLAAVMVATTGCGGSKPAEETKANTEVEVQAETTEAVEEKGTVIVEHSLGTTEVPKNPEKVVVLDWGALDVIDSLGLEAAVVGLPLSGSVPDYLGNYHNEQAYANVGTVKEVDFEAIHELEPDMIISGGRLADYYEELNEIAPTVLLNVDNSDYMNSFKTSMNYFGEIFNKQDEVATKLTEIENQITEIKTKATEKNVNALIALANGDAFSVYGKGSRFGIIHNEFGIAPVDETIEVSTHGQNASFEYVAEQNPDLLFIVDRSAATGGEGSAASMFDNELIHGTDAYKNDRIIYLNPTVWYTAGGGFTSTQTMIDEVSAALDRM